MKEIEKRRVKARKIKKTNVEKQQDGQTERKIIKKCRKKIKIEGHY